MLLLRLFATLLGRQDLIQGFLPVGVRVGDSEHLLRTLRFNHGLLFDQVWVPEALSKMVHDHVICDIGDFVPFLAKSLDDIRVSLSA